MPVKAQSTGNQSGVINGVLAHEMTSQEAQILANSGINWVSCDVTFNPSDDCQWVQIYSLAKQYNLSMIGILDWHLMNYSQTFQLSDWSNAVNQAVTSFGDVVKTWEIWNEPNYPWNCYGCYNGTASSYVALMQVTYNDIKALAPNDTVIGLGGMPLFTGAEPNTSDTYAQQAVVWAQDVVQLGGMNYCDAIAIHAYPYGAYDLISQIAFQYFLKSYQQLCPGKPIWVTEVGQESYSTNWTATQNDQSTFLNQSYTLLQSLGVKAYIWYELNDNYTDRPNSNFGLFDNNGNPKQAFETFANLASGVSSPTPSPSATPPPTQPPTIQTTQPSNSPIPTPTATVTASPTEKPTGSPTPMAPELSFAFILPLIVALTLCTLIARKRARTKKA
jgi:hypothetical protein